MNNLILEDLGIITDGVIRLRNYSGYPYMKVLEFAFESKNSPFLPENYEENCVCYTGTHDNDTYMSFLADKTNRENVRKHFGLDENTPVEGLLLKSIESLYDSKANLVVINPQDLLLQGNDYRFNVPGVKGGNWRYHANKLLYHEDNVVLLSYLAKRASR